MQAVLNSTMSCWFGGNLRQIVPCIASNELVASCPLSIKTSALCILLIICVCVCGGGGGSVVIVGVDSSTTRLHYFLAGVRDMALRVPSPSGEAV